MKKSYNIIILSLSILICSTFVFAGDKPDENRKRIYDNVNAFLRDTDSYKAISYINNLGQPDSVASYYSFLTEEFYWKAKNLKYSIAVARGGILYCLTKADELKNENPELAFNLKKEARVISYNLASFCWPGWAEKDIKIGHDDIITGLDAAKLNLRLVKELAEGDMELAYAYWINGALYLATQDYNKAVEAFGQSSKHAEAIDDDLNRLLAEGYIAICHIVSGNPDGRKKLGQAIDGLNKIGSEDAKYFIEQFNTALDVFIK